jgi:hypothetical protein
MGVADGPGTRMDRFRRGVQGFRISVNPKEDTRLEREMYDVGCLNENTSFT